MTKLKKVKVLKTILVFSVLICAGLVIYYFKTTSEKKEEQKKIEQEEKAFIEYITETPQSDRLTSFMNPFLIKFSRI